MYDNRGNFQYQQPMNPYLARLQQMEQQHSQSYDGVIRVSGMDGAKAYAMPPNSRAMLCFDNDDIFVIKSTDAAGWPTYDAFSFHRIPLESLTGQPVSEFATKSELNALNDSINEIKEMLQNAQQPVRKQPAKPAAVYSAAEQQPS